MENLVPFPPTAFRILWDVNFARYPRIMPAKFHQNLLNSLAMMQGYTYIILIFFLS